MIDAATRGRRRSLWGGIALAGLVYIAAVDPHDEAAMLPRCPTKMVTGLDCPGCGGLRMTHDVLRGDIRAALHDNPFLLLAVPAFALAALQMPRSPKGSIQISDTFARGAAAAALAWTIVRNLPGWPLKPTLKSKVARC